MINMKRITAAFCAIMLNSALLAGCGTKPISTDSGISGGSADPTNVTLTVTQTDAASRPAGTTSGATGSDVQNAQQSTSDPAASAQTAGSTPTTASGSSTAAAGTTARQDSGTTVRQETNTTAGTQDNASTSNSSTETSANESSYAPKELQTMLDSMSLKQKAAQMMFVGIVDEATARQAAADGVGALCLFAKPFRGKSKTQVRSMTASFQSKAAIPMIISADEEGGTINRVSINSKLRAAPFWLGRDLYASGGWDLVISDTKEKAELLLDLGVNVNLAPVADVPLDKSNYIYNRCFSLNANETAEYIRKVVTEMKKDGLGSTLKHFPGYGGSVDTHKNMGYDNRDLSAFENGDLLPFIAGIEAGADAVMVSHNIVRCMDAVNPASLSKNVHDLLRNQLGFKGVIISDDLGMNAITQFTGGTNPAVAAVQAGNDLVAFADYKTSVAAIVSAVKAGKIPLSQIDASVMRILKWKQSLGLI